MMRLATLNIRHGGGARIPVLAEFMAAIDADILVITEYRNNSCGLRLRSALENMRYRHLISSCGHRAENSVLIATRQPLTGVKASAGPVGHEHRLIIANTGKLRVIGVYFPQRTAKRPVFACLQRYMRLGPQPTVVIGDFNTGKPYLDEIGKSFSCADSFIGLEKIGLVDAWRTRNPTTAEFSWFSNKGNGFRIDHAFCTPSWDRHIRDIQYLHSCRLSGSTDHAALVMNCDG